MRLLWRQWAVAILFLCMASAFGFSLQLRGLPTTACHSSSTVLFSSTKKRRQPTSSSPRSSNSILDLEEPAGITGSAFFGGNKVKEELFDPVAEAQAEVETAVTVYDRFQDALAFPTPLAARIGQAMQLTLNSILYLADGNPAEQTIPRVRYASNLVWESCFDTKSGKTPLAAMEKALEFYKSVDVAIVSGTQVGGNQIKLQWQISVVWPIFWGPRILLTGTSDITLNGDDTMIIRQVDKLDSSSDLLSTVADQLVPRFWDTYHIGMTPSAEVMPRVPIKQGLLPKGYNLFEVPARLVSSPTQLDSAAGREDGNAQIIPNHAFSCAIKTIGPQKQEYIPASPLQVQILPSGKIGGPPKLKWSIPLSVDFQTNPGLPLPGEDPEARPDSEPKCEYEFQARRLVATVPFAGSPQDVEIADVRKKLFDSVMKDGLKPILDSEGRPQFFFLQNGVKACYTEEGLGMCVYEWRPKLVKPNEVGIELTL
jgi:Uncharacterized conserved protein (DUF2358)